MKERKTDEVGVPMVSLENRVRDILVVEDDTMLRNFVVGALKREGYNVVSTATAKDAYTHIMNSINPYSDATPYFDVIISDDQLGDGNGSELLLECRQRYKKLDSTYMLLMSGTYRDDKKDEGLQRLRERGIDYLCKVDGRVIERIKEMIKTNAQTYFAEILAKEKQKQSVQLPPTNLTSPYQQQAVKVPLGPITSE